jgi:DNA (cytosine-5)-methyltransferase 1
VWQCEIDAFCRSVLAKHWPTATRYTDVRAIDASAPRVDVICGGFPCQDISVAGQRAGLAGERSGLWSEYARIVGVLRPRFVVVENVAALLGLGMGRVLGDLSTLGYDAEWATLRASNVGAPHQRERLFIVAHTHEAVGQAWRGTEQERKATLQRQGRRERGDHVWDVAPEPRASGVAYGLSKGLDGPRVGALGNAVVPQCGEVVGRVLLAMAEVAE